MAKRLGCKANLTLINDPAYHTFARTLDIDAYLNPRSVTISRVLQHIRRGRIRAVHSVQNGAAEIIEAEALETSPLVGPELRDVELPAGMRIGAVFRDGEVIRPSGDLKVKPRDRVVIFALAEAVKKVEQLFRVSLDFF
jgi:trk system potassium uptake protein TrkA